MATPIEIAASAVFGLTSTPVTAVAANDTFAAVAAGSTTDLDVLANDTSLSSRTISGITAPSPAGAATPTVVGTGAATRIRFVAPSPASNTTYTFQYVVDGSSPATVTVPVTAVVVTSNLPLVPTMDFLASDASLPASPIYVYQTNLGNGSGSSAANAKEIQSAINAATAGQNLVAIASIPGGTSFYGRYIDGLTFPVSGAAGNPITLMARPGDTVVIDKGQEFAAFRNPSPGTSTNWTAVNPADGKHIWMSAAATFGGTARPLSGHWFEFGWPHMIQPVPSLATLQLGTGNGETVYAVYSGPCACVHTDGHVYIRMQIPDPVRMSKNGKWPVGGIMSDWPGAINSSGQIAYPVSQDPRDYAIYLTYAPGNGAGGVAFTFNPAVNNWTIGSGINSVGYEDIIRTNNNDNITFQRGTDLCTGIGIFTVRGVANSDSANMTLQRRRMGTGSIRHTPLLDWKYGGYYSGETAGRNPPEIAYRAYGISNDGDNNPMSNLNATNCTFYGFHDMCGTEGILNAGGPNWKFMQCTFYKIFDDGFQTSLITYRNLECHYCYFLDSSVGGPGFSGIATGSHKYSHCIIDARMPKKFDNDDEEIFTEGIDPLHFDWAQSVCDPRKIYNCTFIVPPDNSALDGGCFSNHARGGKDNFATEYWEYWNNIACIVSDKRYGVNASPSAWQGPCDAPIYRMITDGDSKEAHDFCIIYRDCPFHPNTPSAFTNGIIVACTSADTGDADFNTIVAWKANSRYTNSKIVYSPGYHNSSVIEDPQIPSAVRSPATFDVRRDYRPRNAHSTSLARTTTGTSIAGQNTASWTVLPSPWIGALDPNNTTSCPVGVQQP